MINSFKMFKIATMAITVGMLSTAYATDISVSQKVTNRSSDFFKRGMSAYKNGQIDQAISALHYAANMGHIGANWKLGYIYANGDGVPENDYKAYNFFAHIVEKGADPGSENESYVSDALVKLAGYLRKGIPDSPVKADPSYAVDLYTQAATNYRNPQAQYYLGSMLLKGEGGEKNPVQAARWFQLSAKKGNSSAQAMLGNMLFQAGETVRGVAMLTAAYEKANTKDQSWIRPMQERAFAICDEFERRTAMSLAVDILEKGNS
ncbi:tetratricopeptide repeat protein [Bartonella schoenbuchensis]|uniref:tetratricopeptide repeat protein n=1 Tax=Bartonella schoenbuchensis TaxID=165694 RepID=UPI0031450F27